MSTIMVVDDEPAVCNVLRLALARAGHQVVICGDGQTALDALAVRSVAVALVDLTLPRVFGVRVFEAICVARPHLPVIVMSGALTEAGTGLADQIATSAYARSIRLLPKPFRPKDLILLLATMDASRPEISGPAEFDRKSA
jgi:DNA-binding NtrC family response regulator